MEAFVSLANGLSVAIQPMNLLFALIGYAMGRSVRERVAVLPLESDIPPAPAAIT